MDNCPTQVAKAFENKAGIDQARIKRYMRWAREHDNFGSRAAEPRYASLREMTGGTERQREDRQSKQQQAFRRVLRKSACSSSISSTLSTVAPP